MTVPQRGSYIFMLCLREVALMRKTVAFTVVSLFCWVVFAGDAGEEARRIFKIGADLFEQKRFAEAREKFQEVLRLDPTETEARRMVEEAGLQLFIRMMAEPEMGRAPRKIWDIYRRAMQSEYARIMGPKIRGMVAEAVDPTTTPLRRWRLFHKLQDLGQYVVPALAEYIMSEQDSDRRAYARIVATKLGPSAVLALIELLEHSSALMLENVALTLGDIEPSDHRAIAPLRSLSENESVSFTVRRYADRSLKKITGIEPPELQRSVEYYYMKADRYLRELAGVANEADDARGMIWHLNAEGELVSLQLPLYAWNELMAEQACYDCMRLDPTYEKIMPLFACVMAQQYAEVKELLDIVIEKPPGREMSEDEANEIRDRDLKLRRAAILIRACGARNVYLAVDKCLQDATGGQREMPLLTARVLIDAAKDLDPKGDLLPAVRVASSERRGRGREEAEEMEAGPVGASLVEALEFPDERVQYAAAIALAHMNPVRKFPGAEDVVRVLASAIGESGPLQMLIVSEDAGERNEMKNRLEGMGYGVTLASGGVPGLKQATTWPPKDIIMVSHALEAGGMSTEQFIEQLKLDPRTRTVSFAVLTTLDAHQEDRARFGDIKLIHREDTGSELRAPVEELAAGRLAPNVTKMHSEEIAAAAAWALCAIDPYRTHMVPADCTDACIAALRNRPDEVRLPCINALGKFKIQQAYKMLEAVFENRDNTVEIRAACLHAIARVNPSAMFVLFRKVQKEEPEFILKLYAATGHGLGDPTNDTIVQFIKENRIDREAKEE